MALKLIRGSETLQPDLMPLGEMLEGDTELTFVRVNVPWSLSHKFRGSGFRVLGQFRGLEV